MHCKMGAFYIRFLMLTINLVVVIVVYGLQSSNFEDFLSVNIMLYKGKKQGMLYCYMLS